ncbi:MAG TPA: bifunctional diaminohydroxyphosphoribosylaminopyrimidine deaminase/5-amino-6-(5-phosphoribosylamino)uracil reductase RibD [Nitrospinae bacterium]|nr:bifunctional diaminohydroxyphosphoribosylaminopyrimidine deaminase/5-amino-6-(5-phosphoribosylamino)uracil reductase RibD [Nitrospinota bacterium]HBA26731.1 bifunctional diaminohydroxyphosphoribosylaminopyrimidine deaminase/5-amino-6-(5-phosphoribosylamino)uracil reductase RibD [Nitrospinota bacterium]
MIEKYMKRAIDLALTAKGRTSPNPVVGAVIIKGGKIVGEGCHKKAGTPHAEVNAINSAGKNAKDGIMYVTLEPCCHKGRTPPCTKTIIKSGIKKIVIGMVDPNPIISGKGIEELNGAGIQVSTGLLEKECKRLNEVYIKYITSKKPFVLLKIAMSLDGKIATCKRESKWITSEPSRERVHNLRDEVDAVMVGIGTVLQDNPNLTVSLKRGNVKNPIRIIVDSQLRIPMDSNIIKSASASRKAQKSKVIIAATKKADAKKADILREKGINVIEIEEENKRINLPNLMEELGKMEITSIMIEGGSELNSAALESGIVDKVIFFIAPKIIGGKESVPAVGGRGFEKLSDSLNIRDVTVDRCGNDIVVEGYLK